MEKTRQRMLPTGLFDPGQVAALDLAGARVLGPVTATFAYRHEPAGEREQSAEIKDWARTEQRAYYTLVARVQARAQERGAGGVLGAQFVRRPRPWDDHLFEMTCQGTAISVPSQPSPEAPFVCTLSGTEFLCLRQAGYTPAGHVVGLCAYHQIAHLRVEQKLLSGGRQRRVTPNVERSDFTRGYDTARANAMRRLEAAAQRIGAAGVIGLLFEVRRHRHDDRSPGTGHVGRMTFEFTAQGTALRAVADTQTIPTRHVVPLHL